MLRVASLGVIFMMTSIATASASCGATVKFDGDLKDELGNNRGYGKFGFSISMPLSDIGCRKTEASIAKTREQEREVKIRNLDKISRICRDNADNPAFAQLCHVELPNLLDEVIR